MRFEDYMKTKGLMYFKVVVFNSCGEYVDEFDNFEEHNYDMELVRRFADFVVTGETVVFRKNKGYTISTTTIHIQEVIQ